MYNSFEYTDVGAMHGEGEWPGSALLREPFKQADGRGVDVLIRL